MTPRAMAAIALYAEHGQFAADFGGWDPVLSAAVPDRNERSRVLRLISVVHRAARQHHEDERANGKGAA